METKITSIATLDPKTLIVNVDFLDDEKIVLSRTYPLSVDKTIESIYPHIKEDLNSLEAGKKKIEQVQAQVDKSLDLSNVQSLSEIQAETEQKNREKAEADRLAEEKAAAEKLAAEQAEAERLAQEEEAKQAAAEEAATAAEKDSEPPATPDPNQPLG